MLFCALSWQETLEVKCYVKDPKGCSEKETKCIETIKAKGAEAITKELARLKGMKVGEDLFLAFH